MNRTASLLSSSLLVACLACDPGSSPSAEHSDSFKTRSALAKVPSDWIGYSANLERPRETFVRRAKVIAAPQRFEAPGVAPTRYAKPQERISTHLAADVVVASVDATTGDVFELRLDGPESRTLTALMAARGDTSPSDGHAADPNEPDVEGPGDIKVGWSWSDGVQTLKRRTVADGYSINHNRYRRIGQIGEGCTGTLIGSKYVLTAAHCVVDRTDGTVYSTTFRPRRDPSDDEPFGSASAVHYYFPVNYWNGACSGGGQCNKYDIALIVLEHSLPVPYMGYWYAPISTLDGWRKYKRGYPACWATDTAPPGCTWNALYGDTKRCEIGSWANPDGDGYNREIWMSCDGVRGMSGSAYYTPDSPGGLVALGVYSQYDCTTTACEGNAYPNVMTRITPQVAGWISMAKSIWQ